MSRTYLAHHGIKGQQWGVKNGPPYPLGSLRRTIVESSLAKSLSKRTKKLKLKKLTDEQKRQIIFGSKLAVAFGGAYGAMKINDLFNRNTPFDVDISKLSDRLPIKSHFYSRRQDIIGVNGAPLSVVNPMRIDNCSLCSTTYELRRRGYDVHARSKWQGGGGRTIEQISKAFKGVTARDWRTKYDCVTNNRAGDKLPAGKSPLTLMRQDMLSCGEGARGNLCGRVRGGGGYSHSVVWEVINGNVRYVDTQTGFDMSLEAGVRLFLVPGSCRWLRTDDKELNIDYIKNQVVK